MALRDGDGWVACMCGRPHWGLYGAAGLLLIRQQTEAAEVLLQLRAGWTHGGGTWALPGGALDSHEDPVTAAAREAWEEAGVDPKALDVKGIYTDDHGNWRYDTVIAHCNGEVNAFEANAESEELRWVSVHSVTDYDLHPGLAASWGDILPHVLSTLA